MKLRNLIAAALVTVALTACELPEDTGGTAAENAEVNQQDKKGKKASGAKKSKKSDSAKSDETVSQANARRSAESQGPGKVAFQQVRANVSARSGLRE